MPAKRLLLRAKLETHTFRTKVKSQIMSTKANGIRALVRQLAPGSLNTEAQWISFALPAARLATLGDERHLQRFFRAVLPHQESLLRALRRRALEGIDQLGIAAGIAAAKATIDAQDAACFLEFGKISIFENNPQLTALWEEWIDLSGAANLNETAVKFISDWLKRFPIPPEIRIRAIASPMSEFQMRALARLAPSRQRHEFFWKAHKLSARKDLALFEASVGRPSQAILDGIRETDVPCRLKGRGILLISRWLKEDEWTLCVRVCWKEPYRPADVAKVRIECRRAERDDEDRGVFYFRLATVSYDARMRMLCEQTLHILLLSGEWIALL